MRVTTLATAIGAAAIPVLVGFAGCGGNVTAASAGAGGTGGHTSTTTMGTSAVTASSTASGTTVATAAATSSTTGTAGTGATGAGGSDTDAGSALRSGVRARGVVRLRRLLDVQPQLRDHPPNYDCLLECLDGVPCSQFGIGALTGCQAMCAGDSGPPPFDGGGFDAGPGAACAQCLAGSCQQQAFACGSDMTAGGCFGWLQCQGACYNASPIDPTCFDNCDAMFPNAATEYGPVYACACNSCGTQCMSGDPCSHLGDGG